MNAWNPSLVGGLYSKQSRGFITNTSGHIRVQPPIVANNYRKLASESPSSAEAETLQKAITLSKEQYSSTKAPPFPYTKPTFGYVAEWLSELGKTTELDGILTYADKHLVPTWEDGGLFYPRNDTPFVFTDEDGERKLCYTTSWGLSTRMMGALVMTHGDDNGLRVPPRVAPKQVQIVPITRDDPTAVLEAARELQAELAGQRWMEAPVRAAIDTRDRKPAEKRWEWIRKGAPVVIELGERDIEQGVVTMTRRDDDTLSRDAVPREGAADAVVGVLSDIQLGLFEQANKRLRERTRDDITTLEQFREFFSGDDTDSGGFVKAPWSEDPETEKTMGELGVSVRCIPFDQQPPPDARCVITGGPAKVMAIFAKAY